MYEEVIHLLTSILMLVVVIQNLQLQRAVRQLQDQLDPVEDYEDEECDE